MHTIMEPVHVDTTKGWPVQLTWRDRTVTVQEPIDVWIREGRWWAGSERRVYFLLRTTAGTLILFRGADGWTLSAQHD